MLGSKPVDTPMDPNVKLTSSMDDTPVDKGRFQRLVGNFMYLAYTRPDIAFTVSCVSQFMHCPLRVTYAGSLSNSQISKGISRARTIL